MSLQSVSLRSETSMIEVMRRFRSSPETRILRARRTNGVTAAEDFWRIQFTGPVPQITEFLREGSI
jgi:hypothetical protein